jgi:RNA polymerase sigma-70 factor, ECF subfamily
VDRELVVRAQNGDREAFASLAGAAYARLHRVAQNVLADVGLADDATQQAVVDIWQKLPQLRDVERFEAWTYRIVVNACYGEARRATRWMPSLSATRDRPEPSDPISGVVYRDELERAFRRIPVEQRVVVALHDYLDLPFDEIARILGVPAGTVHSRHHRAMQALRAALEADERLPGADAAAERAP